MTELDKQMDDMLIEIKWLKSDKYINNIKADAITWAVNRAYAEGYKRPIEYLHSLADKLRNN